MKGEIKSPSSFERKPLEKVSGSDQTVRQKAHITSEDLASDLLNRVVKKLQSKQAEANEQLLKHRRSMLDSSRRQYTNTVKECVNGRGLIESLNDARKTSNSLPKERCKNAILESNNRMLTQFFKEAANEMHEGFQRELRKLDEIKADFNDVLNRYRGEDNIDIEKTNTVKRFRRWWNQEGLQLRKDVQTFLEEGKVTIKDLSDWVNKLEKFNQETFPKELKEVKKLNEMIESCSEKYEEDQKTLDLAPNIKELRRLVIAFVEYNDEEALKKVGGQLPNRSRLPRNEPLPDLPDQDLMVLKVAQGMQVIHRSRTEKSGYTPEAFKKYADYTTIRYSGKIGHIDIKKRIKGECRYSIKINLKKGKMELSHIDRKRGPHLSDHIIGDLQLLSSILNDKRDRGNCMNEKDLEKAKKDNMATKIDTFKPKKITHYTIMNEETLNTRDLAKTRYETGTFIFDPDHKTYPACIAMLATSIGYSSIFLVNQRIIRDFGDKVCNNKLRKDLCSSRGWQRKRENS